MQISASWAIFFINKIPKKFHIFQNIDYNTYTVHRRPRHPVQSVHVGLYVVRTWHRYVKLTTILHGHSIYLTVCGRMQWSINKLHRRESAFFSSWQYMGQITVACNDSIQLHQGDILNKNDSPAIYFNSRSQKHG